MNKLIWYHTWFYTSARVWHNFPLVIGSVSNPSDTKIGLKQLVSNIAERGEHSSSSQHYKDVAVAMNWDTIKAKICKGMAAKNVPNYCPVQPAA